MTEKNKTRSFQFWQNHLQAQVESGLSGRKYCLENNLNKNTFGYWVRRIKALEKDNSLVEVNARKPVLSGIEIIVAHNIKIKVEEGFDPVLLRSVINALGNKQ